ncbi:MAG: hypothetical protein F4Z96_07300 [Chloroflexi bacterium]|nr:hypothetical protein [Chloroflexota bacterium]
MPLIGQVERWEGRPGDPEVIRSEVAIRGAPNQGSGSRYRPLATQGATLVPRRLVFVDEVENPARMSPPGTLRVNPRRGRYDKAPWRDLDLTQITGRMVEEAHVVDVYLGESIVPYATRPPLQAALPISDDPFPRRIPFSGARSAIGGIDTGPLRQRMRRRWRTTDALWEENKQPVNRLTLSGQWDYRRKLSSQIEWQSNATDGALRLVYGSSGRPTAAIVRDREAIVDYTLFWIPLSSEREAAYLLAIINSDYLRDAVEPFMPKGQWGARHVQKHLWNLPIPRFDPKESLHAEVADVGDAAAAGAALQVDGQDELTSAAARRIVREWLADSDEGREVERVVAELLGVE